MVSLSENASVTLKGLAHFCVSQRRHHLVGDGSALRILVSGKRVQRAPTPASRRHTFGPYAKLWIQP